MKQVDANEQAVTFQLTGRERGALVQLLQAYPVIPPAHHLVSKELKEPRVAEFQRLLDEALAEQRTGNQRHLQDWLAAPQRFRKIDAGYSFTLERADSEWLLQVLNDIRVGNWLRLGSPEADGMKPENLRAEMLPAWVAMEMSAYLQMAVMEAIGN